MLADVGSGRAGEAINVETFRGTVRLSGFTDTEAEKQCAGQVASTVVGVRAVRNDIRVKEGGS